MNNSEKISKTVMTLDAGGTNLVFSAIRNYQWVTNQITLPSQPDNLDKCLSTIKEGFIRIKKMLDKKPDAISFAFPGPADYPNGIIGDLPNLPAFRGGVALGPYLENEFQVPVFINNDGDLFAYGEAVAGILPYINSRLAEAGCCRRFKNLIGVTIGTGFGGGLVIDNKPVIGDNSAAAEIWLLRNYKFPECFAEESISIRAVKRSYKNYSNDNRELTPKEIYEIAEGILPGNKDAALRSFFDLGEALGDAIANALTLIDGLVVIGGGLTGAAQYFFNPMIASLNGCIFRLSGEKVNRLEMKVYNLQNEEDINLFLNRNQKTISIPGTNRNVIFEPEKKTGVALSVLGTSKAIALGAYAFAISRLANNEI